MAGVIEDQHGLAEVPVPLFYGYTYSAGGTWAGYVPDLRSAAHGGYGADASTRRSSALKASATSDGSKS